MNEINIPDGMPTLSAGAHRPGSGQACVMELVALLAGEEWTDTPKCTNAVLAAIARFVNDRIDDGERHRLVPLIGRLLGTDAPVDDEALEASAWFGGEAWNVYRRSYDKVAWLSALIDEYDRLAGRTSHREVTDAELRTLAATVAGAR